jgi:ABC-type enterochelin transport system ATPase subunit
MLQVRDIYTYYDTSLILQGVSIDVPRGKVVAVLGQRSRQNNSCAQHRRHHPAAPRADSL